jgi:hypothetical protein
MHWEIPNLEVVFGMSSQEDLQRHYDIPHRCFSSTSNLRNRKTTKTHSASLPLPKGAIVECGEKQVASPELVFLQLAGELEFHRLVLLGLQLCSCNPLDPQGALTSTVKLKRFLKNCEGHVGHKRATTALRYVADGSASIMESLLYMLLTLPNHYGGYGLSGAELNHEIKVPPAMRREPKQDRYYVDLFWGKANIALEYDSYEYHSTIKSWVKDTRKFTVLECLGCHTMSINTPQLYNEESLGVVSNALARRLGKRMRIRDKAFAKMHQKLRSMLPRT